MPPDCAPPSSLCYNRPPGIDDPARRISMSETARKISRRSDGHSDVANSAPFRQRIESLVESEFGRALLAEARAARGNVAVRNLSEEWLNQGEGLIYEISADIERLETAT